MPNASEKSVNFVILAVGELQRVTEIARQLHRLGVNQFRARDVAGKTRPEREMSRASFDGLELQLSAV